MSNNNSIENNVLNQARSGTCAIGYLTVKPEEYVSDAQRPFFKVVGTGFLIRENMAITNRHVIEGPMEARRSRGFPESQMFLGFVYGQGKEWKTSFCKISSCATVLNDDLDLAFVEFKRLPDKGFDQCKPLRISEQSTRFITEPVAVCGYPYGTDMLTRNGKIYRFGPVLQQGHISALAPYDGDPPYREILLDIRTAEGMSGAPVFLPSDGTVIGVHYAGWEYTTARSEEKLVAYLAKVETETTGLKRSTRQDKWRERLRRVAHKLLRLDLEDHALSRSKKFQKSLRTSYREYRRKGGVSLETLIAQTERELAHRSRKKGDARPSTGSGRTVSRDR